MFFYPLHLYVFVLICQYYVVLLERTNKDIIYYIYQSFTERGKYLNFKKISPLRSSIQSKLGSIERDLISSYQKEKLYEESLSVTKIKSDSKYLLSFNISSLLSYFFKQE